MHNLKWTFFLTSLQKKLECGVFSRTHISPSSLLTQYPNQGKWYPKEVSKGTYSKRKNSNFLLLLLWLVNWSHLQKGDRYYNDTRQVPFKGGINRPIRTEVTDNLILLLLELCLFKTIFGYYFSFFFIGEVKSYKVNIKHHRF